jgi:hypothetical protein
MVAVRVKILKWNFVKSKYIIAEIEVGYVHMLTGFLLLSLLL